MPRALDLYAHLSGLKKAWPFGTNAPGYETCNYSVALKGATGSGESVLQGNAYTSLGDGPPYLASIGPQNVCRCCHVWPSLRLWTVGDHNFALKVQLMFSSVVKDCPSTMHNRDL
jgi:hypothetical protein